MEKSALQQFALKIVTPAAFYHLMLLIFQNIHLKKHHQKKALRREHLQGEIEVEQLVT